MRQPHHSDAKTGHVGVDQANDVQHPETAVRRRGRPRLELDATELLEQYRRGQTYAQLAELHGVSIRTVMNRLRASPGFTSRSRSKPPGPERLARSRDMLELYRQGLTLAQIGSRYGISMERVRQILTSDTNYQARQPAQRRTARTRVTTLAAQKRNGQRP